MTDSTGEIGLGVKFKMGDGATPTEAFTEAANVKDIKWGGRDAGEVDFTHLGSTGGYKEFRQGLKDPGTITLTVQFDPTHPTHVGANAFSGLFDLGRVFNFKLDMTAVFGATGATAACKGFVKNPGDISISPENPIEATVTIRCTGPVTWS